MLGMGDMLFMQGGGRITRVHGPFVTDDEVETVVAFLREQGEPAYLDDVTEPVDGSGSGGDGDPLMASGLLGGSDSDKSLFDQAVAVVAREGKASTSFIQRHLNIGYNKAAKLIEQMEPCRAAGDPGAADERRYGLLRGRVRVGLECPLPRGRWRPQPDRCRFPRMRSNMNLPWSSGNSGPQDSGRDGAPDKINRVWTGIGYRPFPR